MRIANRDEHTASRPRAGEASILFSIGRNTFAIAASAVHEICSTDSLAGSATEVAHAEVHKVRHTLERRRQRYFVVSACMHFRMRPSRATMVLILRDSRAAVLVDSIIRMTEIPVLRALPHAFSGEERRWYRGLALLDDMVVPVVNPAAFLSEGELAALDAAVRAAGKERAAEHEPATA